MAVQRWSGGGSRGGALSLAGGRSWDRVPGSEVSGLVRRKSLALKASDGFPAYARPTPKKKPRWSAERQNVPFAGRHLPQSLTQRSARDA